MESIVAFIIKLAAFFLDDKPKSPAAPKKAPSPQEAPPAQVAAPKPRISLEDYATASGRYPERLESPEFNKDVRQTAQGFLGQIEAFLSDLGHTGKIDVTSGFRPSKVNAGISNAAVRSLHMTGHAIDLLDDENQTLANLIMAEANEKKQKSLLSKHGLWLEHPKHTRGVRTNWVHLDNSKKRRDRPVRVFTI